MSTSLETLLASLRRHNPARVRAYAGDDDARDIAVPTKRKKWQQVIEAIEARSWSRVELLDKSGAVLGYVENTSMPGDVEDLEPGKVSKTRSDVEWIVNLVVRAQREAVALARERDNDAQRAMVDTLREVMTAQRDINALQREARDAAAEVAALQAAADNGGNMKELLEAAPQILSMLPMLKQLYSGGAAKPKNGA